METLIEQIPEAYEFCQRVTNNINKYKLFPNEHFDTIIAGILTTTERDSQGECLSLSELRNLLDRFQKHTIWFTAEHNPLIQPIGRLVSAERFYCSNEDIHFIAGVIGYYDIDSILAFEDIGINIDKIPQADLSLSDTIEEPIIEVCYNPYEIEDEIIERMLHHSPKVVSDIPKRRFRKAAEPIIIIEISISLFVGIAILSFTKGFFNRLGAKAADFMFETSKKVNLWLKDKVSREVSKIDTENLLFEVTSKYKGCRIRFVIPSKDQETIGQAIDKVWGAARSVAGLINMVKDLEPTCLVYVFDLNTKTWIPRHLTTEKLGIITDEPIEVDLKQYGGLSIDGATTFLKETES